MTPAILFFIFGGVGVLFAILAFSSFGFMFKRFGDTTPTSFGSHFSFIMFCWIVCFVCELGALISGIVWIVNKFAP